MVIPSDGRFDLCLAGDVKQIRILPLAATFISGKQGGDPDIRMVRAQRISIRAINGGIPAHADGETLCTAGQGSPSIWCRARWKLCTGLNGTAHMTATFQITNWVCGVYSKPYAGSMWMN
jgi:hypothetical protein